MVMVRPISPWRAFCATCDRKLDVMAADADDATDEVRRHGWESTTLLTGSPTDPAVLICTVCASDQRKTARFAESVRGALS